MSILNGVSSSDCLLMNGCVDVSRFRPCFLSFVLSASNSDFVRFGMTLDNLYNFNKQYKIQPLLQH
jgi:hypothetical protein